MITVGSLLKKRRLEKGVDLDEIEKELRIRKKYLQAVEKNDWGKFVSRVYAEGIVKSYAKFLGIPKEKILPYFRRDFEKYEGVKFRKKIEVEKLSYPKAMRLILILSFLFLSLFFSWQIYLYLKPPKLTVLSPSNTDVKTRKKSFLIKGKVERDVEVKINGETILPNKDGYFERKVSLFKGRNIFVIEAKGPNGRKTKKRIVIEKLTP